MSAEGGGGEGSFTFLRRYATIPGTRENEISCRAAHRCSAEKVVRLLDENEPIKSWAIESAADATTHVFALRFLSLDYTLTTMFARDIDDVVDRMTTDGKRYVAGLGEIRNRPRRPFLPACLPRSNEYPKLIADQASVTRDGVRQGNVIVKTHASQHIGFKKNPLETRRPFTLRYRSASFPTDACPR